jgi:zinc transport system substrate-binding protein
MVRLMGVLLLAAVAVTGCKKPGASGKPGVAVSIFPIYDVARRIAGDRLDVMLILPPGQTEHSYSPTPKEAARFSGAKLAVLVGLEMDEWAHRIVEGAAGKITVLELAPELDPLAIDLTEVGAEEVEEAEEKEGEHDHEHEHEHGKGDMDPHVWMDPVRMQKACDLLVAAYSKLDPEGAKDYAARGEEVKKSLAALHDSIDKRAKGWSKKTIVTFHGSMQYYAHRYGLKIAAVIEPFPGSEPTPKYQEKVIAAVKSAGAAALFSEPQLEKAPAKVIADRSGVPLYELDPVGGTEGVDSYEKLLTHDTDVLEKALK